MHSKFLFFIIIYWDLFMLLLPLLSGGNLLFLIWGYFSIKKYGNRNRKLNARQLVPDTSDWDHGWCLPLPVWSPQLSLPTNSFPPTQSWRSNYIQHTNKRADSGKFLSPPSNTVPNKTAQKTRLLHLKEFTLRILFIIQASISTCFVSLVHFKIPIHNGISLHK